MAEKKDCANCKYDDKMPFELPCNGCFYQDRFTNWEPIPTPPDKVEGGKEGEQVFECSHRFTQVDCFWRKCSHCGMMQPLQNFNIDTSDTKLFTINNLKMAWNAFYMKGFPHNTDSYGNHSFEEFVQSINKL